MKKNDLVELNITSMTAEGSGVGRVDGFAVFVPQTAVGDRVQAHIIKVTKSYAVGKLKKVLDPSPDRVENDCPVFDKCGGCVYRHIGFAAECRIKKQRVEDCLRRIGGLDIQVDSVESGAPDAYRNKAQYPVGESEQGVQIGFFAPHSHRIIDCRNCRLQPAEFEDVLEVFEDYMAKHRVPAYDERTGRGLLRHIYIRQAAVDGKMMVCAVVNGKTLPNEDALVDLLKKRLGDRLKTVVLNINTKATNVILSDKCRVLYGDGYLNDVLCGVKVRLNALSFYQVNHEMAERLYYAAAEFAGKGDLLLDLYCGAGTIGLSMTHNFGKIIGVEVIEQAVEDAKFNAAENGIENADFICADAHEAAKRLEAEGLRPDVVAVDPPRKGLAQGLPKLIAEKMKPKRVVYVSCDPATLARDLAAFAESGYVTHSVKALNLFPRTAHIESVALLTRAFYNELPLA